MIPATRGQWIAIVVADAVLAGFGGYALGQRGSSPTRGSADVGFLVDMIDHHDQAVQLSLIEIRNGGDPDIQHFAHEILRQQSVEIGLMTERLHAWGQERRTDVGPAMKWMNHEHRSDAMPGMASTNEVDALGVARDADADALFVRLIQDHHRGGAEMASAAATRARSPWVKDLAARMAQV